MARATGRASPVASTPPASPPPTRTSRISSVAYAVEEIGSEENTASATRLLTRSWASWAVLSAGPRRSFLVR
jgi:hypothetical protein